MTKDDKKLILTQEGFDELKEELNERKTTTREKIANDIELAREQGDLSENASYKAAMEDKDFNEIRIEELDRMIGLAEVQVAKPGNNKLDLGESFKLLRTSDKKVVEYKLVGGNEANPQEGKISLDSPIGKAVHGKKFGDIVEIDLPTGSIEFKLEKA